METFRLLATMVHLDYFKRTGGIDGHEIGGNLLVGGIGYFLLENIGLEMIVGIVKCLKTDFTSGICFALST